MRITRAMRRTNASSGGTRRTAASAATILFLWSVASPPAIRNGMFPNFGDGRDPGHSPLFVEGAAERVISIHGSGSNNMAECMWSVMDKFMTQSKHPVRLTYRSVGHDGGQMDFVNHNNPMKSAMHFGVGDLPLGEDTYDELQNVAGVQVLQLPVLLDTVSFFHSVPARSFDGAAAGLGMTEDWTSDPLTGQPHDESGRAGLNLTACLLGRIFSRNITKWSHEDIAAINPGLHEHYRAGDLDIKVFRPEAGHGATDAATRYMARACARDMIGKDRPSTDAEEIWSGNNVGETVQWDAGTEKCPGRSEQIAECIGDYEGAIGFVETRYGTDLGLREVHLPNFYDDFYMSSATSAMNDGITESEESLVLPSLATQSFHGVDYIDFPGVYTWPMIQPRYLYVRKSVNQLAEDPMEQTLLIAFLLSFVRDEYIQPCVDEFGLHRLPQSVELFVKDAINDDIVFDRTGSSDVDHSWMFETPEHTLSTFGAKDYVISQRRNSIAEIEIQSLKDQNAELTDLAVQLRSRLRAAMLEIRTLHKDIDSLSTRVDTLGDGTMEAGDDLDSTLALIKDTTVMAEDAVSVANQALTMVTEADDAKAAGDDKKESYQSHDDDDDDEKDIATALTLSSISMTLWTITVFVLFMNFLQRAGVLPPGKHDATSSSSSPVYKDDPTSGSRFPSLTPAGSSGVEMVENTSRSESPTNVGYEEDDYYHNESSNNGGNSGSSSRLSPPGPPPKNPPPPPPPASAFASHSLSSRQTSSGSSEGASASERSALGAATTAPSGHGQEHGLEAEKLMLERTSSDDSSDDDKSQYSTVLI